MGASDLMQKADKFYKEYLGQEWDIDIKIGRINCGTLISKISWCPISFILSVIIPEASKYA